MMKNSITALGLALLVICSPSFAQTTIEAGTATLPPTPTPTPAETPFTMITFTAPFLAGTVPNVFPMTTLDGDDPCTIRIRNVTNVGFEAACQEPVNEDNAHPGMVFDYIAVQDGGVTVPLASGAGDVEFRSECVETSEQQFGPTCDNCSGAQGFTAVPFSPAFGSVPSTLTQIQTTNNTLAGTNEPTFLDVAFQTNSLSTTGFNVALDQMEAGNGPLTESERVCYLAVEQNGCQELDFTTLSGPPSVQFQSLFGGNVDGFGNGCTSGEGATFEAGCFTSTPIAIAKPRSRAGNNGGFVRRCAVSATEITLTFDEDRVSNAERNHIDEQVSILAFGAPFTTPVTLNQALVTQLGRRTTFEWETSSETFHLGFNLWGLMGEDWVQLNRVLIQGSGIDTANTSQYTNTIRLTRQQFNLISQFGISSIDTSGYEEFFGPFEVDQEYGDQAAIEAVDWNDTRAKFEQLMTEQGYVKINNRWRKRSARLDQRIERRAARIANSSFEIDTAEPGMHSINAAELISQNSDWQGVALNKVAMLLNGEPVTRHIISDDDLLSEDDRIVFYAQSPRASDAIYLTGYTYKLSLDEASAISATTFDGRVDQDTQLSNNALFTQTLTTGQIYSALIVGDDPWYDSRLITRGAPVSRDFDFDFEQPVAADQEGQLALSIFGSIDLPEEGPDHHAVISVNGVVVEDVFFDGFSTHTSTVTIPTNVLKQSGNTVTVTLPRDTGFFADLILIDELTVTAPLALENVAVADFTGSATSVGYELRLPASANTPQVYAYNTNGALSSVQFDSQQDTVRFASLPEQAGLELRYVVSDANTLLAPSDIRTTTNHDFALDGSDYLIVAHPTFIGEALTEFAQFKDGLGHNTRIINWLEIVDAYGFGNDTPTALNNFLQAATSQTEINNVLIVGGHTNDYRDIDDQGIVNFIPAHYRRVNIIEYSPSDNPYADLDGDNVPELAVGRWPVRSVADLDFVINKTISWHNNRAASQYQTALLISQQNDNRNLDFAAQMQGRVGLPLSYLEEFDQIDSVELQAISNSGTDEPNQTARDLVADAINSGVELVSFAGHANLAAWGTQSLINTEFVKGLANAGKPVVVMPLACYTTNYESTSVNTLAHQWLFAGDQGAAAVHGATVLGEHRENGIFAERYLKQAATSDTIGQAILKAKQQMAPWNEMLNNWVLLGDPALPLR